MRHVSWRYSELKILESWEFPVLCFTAGKIDMSAMVEMDSIPSGRRLARDVLTTCRSRTNKRSWPLPCRILPVAPGSTLSTLARQRRHLSPSTIYRALRRVGLGTRSQRLVVLERHSAQRGWIAY